MKRLLLLMTLVAFTACKKDVKEPVLTTEEAKPALKPIDDAVLETAVIYEANIRQYSAEGTFDAFTKDIPQLKDLGVKIIWLMPINPISETKRKATGGDFAYKIEDEAERAKMLGSYYAVTDYTKVNPEFGNIEDFRELVKTAHDNGIYVILDWVPNHTGWDHIWIKEHPEFYVKNADGEITDPLNPDGTSKGWGDVAQLDYTNMDMQKQMIADMKYWVAEEQVDGFRCDHIEPTPVAFWADAISQLKAIKPVFMLAENDDPKFMKGDSLFEMEYGWKLHHLANEIVKGEKTLSDFSGLMDYIKTAYEADDIIMNFVTNHDENSWAGTVNTRLGAAKNVTTALMYMAPGMPLVYSGQEYNLNHSLKFFEKDSIPKTKGDYYDFLSKLGKLKNENAALNGGKEAAGYEHLDFSNEQVLAFKREKDGESVYFIGNFSDKEQTAKPNLTGTFTNFITGEKVDIANGADVKLEPWGYRILVTE